MNVLLLGSGGREHAFAWKIAQSNNLNKLWIAPGNAGTAQHGENIALNPLQFDEVARFVRENAVDMLIVGPEEPLVRGIADYFEHQADLSNLIVIGPKADGAQLEGSKDFSKAFMLRHGIPTARYQSFTPQTLEAGKAFLSTLKPPFVLKASGLAAGKGVVIPETLLDAEAELEAMLGGKFGEAGNVVVIEEFLPGLECSVFVLSDGKHYLLLPEAKDHKRIGEGDTGLNTGGMGAFSPVSFCDGAFMEKVESRIIRPTMKGLIKEGIDYKGFIFFGLMNVQGEPYVIEYNCRMGDPETEVVLPRLENDILDVFRAVGDGTLNKVEGRISRKAAATVVTVSEGYPESYQKGYAIAGLEHVNSAQVFHAGTSLKEGKVLTAGGRVLAFTGMGNTVSEALSNSYEGIKKVCYDNIYFRRDIGKGF